MKRLLIGLVLFSMGSAFAASAEVEAAMAKGVRFLLAKQAPEGHWSDAQMPALSALPVWAIAACGGENTIAEIAYEVTAPIKMTADKNRVDTAKAA